jgi:hypothetical protein
MKKLLSTTVLVVVALVIIFAIPWKRETVAPIAPPPEVSHSVVESNVQDSVFTTYTNETLGFEMKIPRSVSIGTTAAGETTTVAVLEDPKSGVVFVWSAEYLKNGKREATTLKDIETRGCDQYSCGWAIIADDVSSNAELASYIKNRFGNGCVIREQQPSPTDAGVMNVFVGPLVGAKPDSCMIDYAYVLKYSAEKKKVVSWQLGQDVRFVLGDESLDKIMIDSFKFL